MNIKLEGAKTAWTLVTMLTMLLVTSALGVGKWTQSQNTRIHIKLLDAVNDQRTKSGSYEAQLKAINRTQSLCQTNIAVIQADVKELLQRVRK